MEKVNDWLVLYEWVGVAGKKIRIFLKMGVDCWLIILCVSDKWLEVGVGGLINTECQYGWGRWSREGKRKNSSDCNK